MDSSLAATVSEQMTGASQMLTQLLIGFLPIIIPVAVLWLFHDLLGELIHKIYIAAYTGIVGMSPSKAQAAADLEANAGDYYDSDGELYDIDDGYGRGGFTRG
jgi:hypothetical protein